MHQTFYIDVDEEISSVIDRLNKSMSQDNYFVLPKRAVFLQSIVNLKLLKREADKIGKRVIIVTQDEIGASMANRSDLEVRETLEGLDSSSDVYIGQQETEEAIAPKPAPKKIHQDSQRRLSSLGTKEYYSSPQEVGVKQDISESHVANTKKTAAHVNSKQINTKQRQLAKASASNSSRKKQLYKQQLDPQKLKALEKIYYSHDGKKIDSDHHPAQGKIKRVITLFLVFAFVCLLCVAAYLIVPSAKIVAVPNIEIKKTDLDIQGDAKATEIASTTIPLRVVQINETVTLSNSIGGQKTSTGQKAKGTVAIYNEYSNQPQTLVATTRLQTQDGKIYHILKTVTIPGAVTSGQDTKPGVITTDVEADQGGSQYNTDSAQFTIPGFSGSPKFDKFYAKVTSSITGGTDDGQVSAGGKVAQQDIDGAKQKTENAFKDKIAQDINDALQNGEIAMPQAQKVTIAKSSANAKVGANVSSIDYTVTGSVQALVFKEDDIKDIIQAQSKNNIDSQSNTQISKIDYGVIDPDFDNAKFALKVHGEITIIPRIDQEQLKKDLLGKSDGELTAAVQKYTNIKNVSVEFSPTFISRVPEYDRRVSIEIKQP